jgi:hypothetical protein
LPDANDPVSAFVVRKASRHVTASSVPSGIVVSTKVEAARLMVAANSE